MPTYNDYGIILSTSDLAEADKILNIYTKGSGLVRAIAKGARKTSSKFLGKVDRLSCCYFHFAKGKNLDIVSECSQINSFGLLRSDLVRLTSGILFLEIVDSFAYEMESESKHIYELLHSSLHELEKTENIELLSVRFILSFLLIHGLSPQLETCVACSKEVKRATEQETNKCFPYSTLLGGILCKECAETINYKAVDSNVFSLIEQVNDKCRVKSNRDVRLALDLLREHIDVRAKNKIKSFDLVFSL